MANEAEIKAKIYKAVQEAHITHGEQAAVDRLWISKEDSKRIADAVFEALHKVGMLNLG